jgi:hypothetical protein
MELEGSCFGLNEVLFWKMPGETKEKHEKLQSG